MMNSEKLGFYGLAVLVVSLAALLVFGLALPLAVGMWRLVAGFCL